MQSVKTPDFRNVYIDIENTLKVPFQSGIRRVVRELVPRLAINRHSNWRFIPVRHCPRCDGWLRLPQDILSSQAPQSIKPNKLYGIVRSATENKPLSLIRKPLRAFHQAITHDGGKHKDLLLPEFEADSVFFDMDSSWHNAYSRQELFHELKQRGVTIVTLHYDIIPLIMPNMIHHDTLEVYSGHLNAHLKYSSLLISISDNSVRDLQQRFRLSMPIESIRLGDRFTKSESEPSGRSLQNDIQKYILCVGTLEPRKNHGVLINVFDRLASQFEDLHLIIVGGKGWGVSEVTKQLRNNPLINKRIHWLTNADDNQLARLYNGAHLCVVPSLYEGFGLPVTESLSSGCVTLSSNGGALREAGELYADYFSPGDEDALTRLIQEYLTNKRKYIDRKNKISNRPKNTWDDTASRVISIFNKHLIHRIANNSKIDGELNRVSY